MSKSTFNNPSSVISRPQRLRSSRSADIPMLMTTRSVGTVSSLPSWLRVTDSTWSVPLMETRFAFMILWMLLLSSSFSWISSARNSALRWTRVVSVTESATRAMSMALLPPPNMVIFFPTMSSLRGRM